MSKPASKVNWPAVVAITVTYVFMIGTASISFSHIVSVSETLGLGWEAWTVPFLVDGIALLGLIGRGCRFAPGTRRAGLVLVTVGGALSLACNVYAGHTPGQKAYGVLIVGGFVLTEWYAGKIKPNTTSAEQLAAKRSDAARKAAVTRKANLELARQPKAKPRAKRSRSMGIDLEATYAMPSAPVSPAPSTMS